MFFTRFKSRFLPYYRQPRIRRALKTAIVVLIGVGWIFSQFVSDILTLEQTVLLGVVLLVVSSEIVETKIYDIEELFEESIQTYPDNYESKNPVVARIAETEPERGYIISYSGSTGTSKSPTKELIQIGATVHVLVKNPLEAINEDEVDLIIDALKSRYEFDERDDGIGIRFYDEQASMKGLKTDDTLVLSWYTFAERRGREVMGHKNPAIKVEGHNSREFEDLNDFFEEVYYSLWSSGTTPIELYERDDCPEELARWVERQRGSERVDWLESISGKDYENRAEMFP